MHTPYPHCIIHRDKKDFTLPPELVQAAVSGNLVIFAGAGISTENFLVLKTSLYRDIKNELNIDAPISFSDLMSKYTDQPNGRIKLLNEIRERLDRATAFPELHGRATQFHRALSTISQIKDIITTNWDTFFETECGAQPIVTSHDFAFSNIPGRKVFKIHGSISNIGSIVATSEDYKICQKNLESGLLGNQLRLMLATKTVVFIGYALEDEDFIGIYKDLIQEIQDFRPHAYIVTPDEAHEIKFPRMTKITTDGTFFLERLKSELIQIGALLSDEILAHAIPEREIVFEEHCALHNIISFKKCPEMIYAAFYQDGLMHSFERLVARMHAGEYSPRSILHQIDLFEKSGNEKRKSGHFEDVAYIEGYIAGLRFLLADEKQRKKISYYHIYGYAEPIRTLSQYKKLLKKVAIPKEVKNRASTIASKFSEDIVLHHPPWL